MVNKRTDRLSAAIITGDAHGGVLAATELGYTLRRGGYRYAVCDRLDRWYWDRDEDDFCDRRGMGHATRLDALEALEWTLL